MFTVNSFINCLTDINNIIITQSQSCYTLSVSAIWEIYAVSVHIILVKVIKVIKV